ncbi:hypothetical protein KW805_04355 [Candidatus Pacearchaeota archaeon]|nr:hypothetical protein [Candidatus Pacearchaeota archaeon]
MKYYFLFPILVLCGSILAISLASAEEATTTLRVITNVINDNGGTATSQDAAFSVRAPWISPGNPEFVPIYNDTDLTLFMEPGPYDVTYRAPRNEYFLDYNRTVSEGCSGNIQVGQHIICTVTYDDPDLSGFGFVHIVTHVINDNLGTANPSDFAFFITSPTGDGRQRQIEAREADITVLRDPGPYDLYSFYSKTGGYTRTLSDDCSGTVAAGETKTCVIIYDDPPLILLPQHWCYQESSTISTPCGGLAGGSYSSSNNDTLWMDGDWHTTLYSFQRPGIVDYYTTYKKPARALPTSVLKLKDYTEEGDTLFSFDTTYKIPEACFSQSDLQFRFTLGYGADSDFVKSACWGGNTWVVFRNLVKDDAGMMEEAMIWGMAATEKDCKVLQKGREKECMKAVKEMRHNN